MYDIRSIHSYIRLPDNKTYNEVVNELVNINIRINNIQRVEHPLVRDHSVATPALLCHKDTVWKSISCLSPCLYGLRVASMHRKDLL